MKLTPTLYKTKILGTGAFYPEKCLTNDDLAKMVDTSDEWIVERTGIKKRYISSKDGGEFPTDMAHKSSLQAIENAGISPNEIDLIIFATLTADYKLPNCASILQTKLGITNGCGAVDVAAACSGFIYGLNMASALVKTGAIKKALIVGSEMLSTTFDWTDRNICVLFGDGSGAAVIGRNEDPNDPSDIHSTILGADGSGREYFQWELGGVANPITKENVESNGRYMQMQGREMFRVAVRTLADVSQKALDQANITLDELNWFVPHQANIRIIEATGKRLGIPTDKVIVNIHDYANTSAATIPAAFHQAIMKGQIKRGQKILFATFGAGLTTGSTVLTY